MTYLGFRFGFDSSPTRVRGSVVSIVFCLRTCSARMGDQGRVDTRFNSTRNDGLCIAERGRPSTGNVQLQLLGDLAPK
jgi:hypothetical protein